MASVDNSQRSGPRPATSHASLASSSALKLEARQHDEHLHRRFFIGPMPEKILPDPLGDRKGKKKAQLESNPEEYEEAKLNRIINEHAFAFFIRHGGREEDWNEDEEQSVRREMVRRWRESPWAVMLRNRREAKGNKATNRWIGSSFEVGEIAGINVIQEVDATRSFSCRASFQSSSGGRSTVVPYVPLDAVAAEIVQNHQASVERPSTSRVSSSGQTFVTASSEPPSNKSILSARPSTYTSIAQEESVQGIHQRLESPSLLDVSPTIPPDPSISSNVELLPPGAREASSSRRQSSPKRPIIKLPSFVKGDKEDKQKRKKVHYAPSSTPEASGPSSAQNGAPVVDESVPPAEVLQRSGEDVQDTSAGAMSTSADITDLQWGDVVMRDRMLVRIFSSNLDALPRFFDEHKHRQTRDLDYEDWQEFIVVWRMDRIELYENYTVPGEEWFRGHKNLSYIIPLKSGRTRLSIYSFVDLTFCITCPLTSRRYNPARRKWQVITSQHGTFIYIFKMKCRSRAYDWTWQLWRHLGGQLPPTISVRNPRLDSKVNIDMPAVDSTEAYKVFQRENVINLCIENLRTIRDWKYILERQIAEGRVLELAWRREAYLDWIWLDNDVDGNRRNWAVLCGLVLTNSTVPAQLEIRVAEHFPRFVRLKDGSRLVEPPAMEGYLDRIKPNSQAKSSVYLSIHDGNLFCLNPASAQPPTPLGPILGAGNATEHPSDHLRLSEVKRGAQQILGSYGVADLRDILVVRRAVHPVAQNRHDVKEQPEDESWVHTWSVPEVSEEDAQDEGGDEPPKTKPDEKEKETIRTRRSFELLFKNGHIVRFEAYSCRYAAEWVQRLQYSIHYWRLKHRDDAREEMDLAQTLRPRVTPKTYQEKDRIMYAELPPDLSAPMPALGSLYNWCVLEGCKPIVRGGKLFTRQGLRGQYKLVQMFIVAENIVQFRIKPNSSLHLAEPKKIHLMDAYVCSGYFAAQSLPSGQYNANATSEARRYQDGLEADDPEEDRLFVIWYRTRSKTPEDDASATAAHPPLDSKKKKMAVFRTRSKMERDAWCWALNCEIERIARRQRDRETGMREAGGLMVL